jgi:hypothetical protein
MRKTAKQKARERFESEVIKLREEIEGLMKNHINRLLIQFENKAFNLAVKHAETIKEIKGECKEAREL